MVPQVRKKCIILEQKEEIQHQKKGSGINNDKNNINNKSKNNIVILKVI